MPSPSQLYKQLWAGVIALPLSLLTVRPVFAQLCADPISPLCCPSPCPIFDITRVPKLLSDVQTLQQSLVAGTQIAQSVTQLGQAIGGAQAAAGAVVQQLAAFPSTISGEFTSAQMGLPTNPVAALNAVKQAMFETVGQPQSSVTQRAAMTMARLSALQGEQVGAIATSLMRSDDLPNNATFQMQLENVTAGSGQMHEDLAANSLSRLALYQATGNIHQLVSAWVSGRAIAAGARHPLGGGGAIPQPLSNAAGGEVAPASPVSQAAQVADQLVTLHDARVSANTILSAYQPLQQTIASSGLADQFSSTAEMALQKTLTSLGMGSDEALSKVEKALLAADPSGWLDGGKDARADQAAGKVLALLASNGSSSPGRISEDPAKGAMSGWLDANKQSAYWHELAQNARDSMSALDSRLGVLSNRVGMDVTSSSAAEVESRLIKVLRHDPLASRWKDLIAATAGDPEARSVVQIAVTK